MTILNTAYLVIHTVRYYELFQYEFFNPLGNSDEFFFSLCDSFQPITDLFINSVLCDSTFFGALYNFFRWLQ